MESSDCSVVNQCKEPVTKPMHLHTMTGAFLKGAYESAEEYEHNALYKASVSRVKPYLTPEQNKILNTDFKFSDLAFEQGDPYVLSLLGSIWVLYLFDLIELLGQLALLGLWRY